MIIRTLDFDLGELISWLGSSVVVLFFLLIVLSMAIKVVPEYRRLVLFRLGRLVGSRGPGIVFILPFLDRAVTVDLRILTLDVPVQEVITKDNVTMEIDTVVYYQITDPMLFTYGVSSPLAAIENLTATTLRNIIGDLELDESLTSRELINSRIRVVLDEATDPWGIKVTRVELKNILPPDVVGDHISIVPTLVELIAPAGFKYHSIAPSLFDSDGVAFNSAAFLTEKIAGEIASDTVELLPHVASADLDSVNLSAERESATKVISAMRTVAWWILKRGLDF